MMELEKSSIAGSDNDKTNNRHKYALDEPL